MWGSPGFSAARFRLRAGALLSAALTALWPARARCDQPLTLQAALREARAANARLPVARMDVESGQARIREARAELWPALSGEGDLRYATPASAYPNNGSEERLELFARGPLYDGGALRAREAVASAAAAGFVARYQVAEADVDFEVRIRFSTVVEAAAAVSVENEAVDRLAKYLDDICLRQLGGQGLETDRLKTEAELATQRIAAADAELRLGQARYALNDVLGRDPRAPLSVAELPAPTMPPRPPSGQQPWRAVPDLAGAAADVSAADHGIAVARAERKPHLFYELGGGYLGVADARYPGDPFGQRALRGFGLSLMLSYDWTLFDFGAYRARLEQAQIALDRARDQQVVVYRGARLAAEGARLELPGALPAIAALRRGRAQVARRLSGRGESVPRGRQHGLGGLGRPP